MLTGLRRGAVFGLQWEDVRSDREEIVTKSKGRAGGKIVSVPITPAIDDLLDRIGRRDVGPIITFRGNAVADPLRAWRSTRAKAGLPDIRFHDLRHTFAQQLFDASGNLSLVQDALHHVNPRITRRYAHRDRSQIREALIAIQKRAK